MAFSRVYDGEEGVERRLYPSPCIYLSLFEQKRLGERARISAFPAACTIYSYGASRRTKRNRAAAPQQASKQATANSSSAVYPLDTCHARARRKMYTIYLLFFGRLMCGMYSCGERRSKQNPKKRNSSSSSSTASKHTRRQMTTSGNRERSSSIIIHHVMVDLRRTFWGGNGQRGVYVPCFDVQAHIVVVACIVHTPARECSFWPCFALTLVPNHPQCRW